MTPEQRALSGWVNRPLAMLPAFARAPYANTKSTVPVLKKSVAVIPISGALTSDQSDAGYGVQSYADIRRAFVSAMQASDVDAVALLIDSPGGTVSGCFDLADTIHAARGAKPIHAILNENAYSAGYALASAADRITIPRTGGAGSVGVITMHVDISKLLDSKGVKVTPLTYGALKADGNMFEPLSAETRVRTEAELKEAGDLFVDTVARNRRMAPSAVKATEAACFSGSKAVDIGFVDAIAAPDAAFAALLSSL